MCFELQRDGLELKPALLDPHETILLERLLGGSPERAGERVFGNSALQAWLASGSVGTTALSILGAQARPVRAIFFDKNPTMNWALGWHQDRTIAVRKRTREPGFDHWTTKAGVAHVEPPFSIIERMITARIHLDIVNDGNAPLLASPGSHLFGRVAKGNLQEVVNECGTVACLAGRGDVWLYRTAILHASERSESNTSRRVLQVDFSSEDLPGRLEWLGIA